jgi:hypothetical protein
LYPIRPDQPPFLSRSTSSPYTFHIITTSSLTTNTRQNARAPQDRRWQSARPGGGAYNLWVLLGLLLLAERVGDFQQQKWA